jgi:hypothetical protein
MMAQKKMMAAKLGGMCGGGMGKRGIVKIGTDFCKKSGDFCYGLGLQDGVGSFACSATRNRPLETHVLSHFLLLLKIYTKSLSLL